MGRAKTRAEQKPLESVLRWFPPLVRRGIASSRIRKNFHFFRLIKKIIACVLKTLARSKGQVVLSCCFLQQSKVIVGFNSFNPGLEHLPIAPELKYFTATIYFKDLGCLTQTAFEGLIFLPQAVIVFMRVFTPGRRAKVNF